MIKLTTEYYCQDCPYFEIQQGYNQESDTILIRCRDQHKCADLYKRFTAIDKAASINPDSCE